VNNDKLYDRCMNVIVT